MRYIMVTRIPTLCIILDYDYASIFDYLDRVARNAPDQGKFQENIIHDYNP